MILRESCESKNPSNLWILSMPLLCPSNAKEGAKVMPPYILFCKLFQVSYKRIKQQLHLWTSRNYLFRNLKCIALTLTRRRSFLEITNLQPPQYCTTTASLLSSTPSSPSTWLHHPLSPPAASQVLSSRRDPPFGESNHTRATKKNKKKHKHDEDLAATLL